MNYVALVQLNAAEYDDSNTLEMKRNSMDGWHEHKADLSFYLTRIQFDKYFSSCNSTMKNTCFRFEGINITVYKATLVQFISTLKGV